MISLSLCIPTHVALCDMTCTLVLETVTNYLFNRYHILICWPHQT